VGTALAGLEANRVVRAGDDQVAGVEPEGERPVFPLALGLQLDGDEGRVLDLDAELLDRRDQHEAAVGLAAQYGREEPHHRLAADRASLVIPGAVPRDAHRALAAMARIPARHRRQLLLGR
jgi:hypothetical protein